MQSFLKAPTVDIDSMNTAITAGEIIVTVNPEAFNAAHTSAMQPAHRVKQIFIDSTTTRNGKEEEVYGVKANGQNYGQMYVEQLSTYLTVYRIDLDCLI